MTESILEKIEKYLEREFHKKIYITENGCKLINQAQEMITWERIVTKDKKNILVPECQLQLVNDETINAFTTKIDSEYVVLINKGIVDEQESYLKQLDWSFISDAKQITSYIDDIIVFHEYAHIFCGHIDAELSDLIDKKAQECEADIFSMDYLVKYIERHSKNEEFMLEIEKLFLAAYFLFEKMKKENGSEYNNDKLIQNYYDEDRIKMRNHPLVAQRILYLYQMLDIAIVTDKIQVLPIKKNVLEKLRVIKRLTDVELPKRDREYLIASESVQQLKKTMHVIREKIPRIGDSMGNG